ncbi:chloride channel protein [Oceanivirga miroungae]|nr:chloride channel protein [Oceanivirga miroungae]
MGIITYIFGTGLLFLSSYRENHIYLILFLPFIGAIVYYVYEKYAKILKKGMKHVKASYNYEEDIDKKLIPFITISTWLSHLFGASVGREGVAVQIGASFSNLTYKYFKLEKHIAILAGMSAGFSGLFGTPLAAIIFPIEILHNREKKLGIADISIIILSSFIASFTSAKLGLPHFKFKLTENYNISLKLILVTVIASILFSISAVIFTKLTSFLKPYLSKNIIRVFLLSIVLALIIYYFRDGRYAGLGTNLISLSFENNGTSILNLDFLFKLLLTSFSLSLFYQGGEVTPLFAMGSSLGVIISNVFNVPVYLFASLGYIGVFSGSTNTLITPMMIAYEVFGYNGLVYAVISSVLIYFITRKNSIY